MVKDGKIYGLCQSTNGRSCEQHACCGKHVHAHDLICFMLTVVDYKGTAEEAIEAVLIKDGTETCTVAFLPCHVVCSELSRARYIGKFAQSIELYKDSTNKTMQR